MNDFDRNNMRQDVALDLVKVRQEIAQSELRITEWIGNVILAGVVGMTVGLILGEFLTSLLRA